MKYHINGDNEIKLCKAKKGNCLFSPSEHFHDKEKASNYLTTKLEKEYEIVNSASKKSVNNVPDIESSIISANYNHLSIISNHMHNGSDVGNVLELYYYSSAQGKAELERRINNSIYNDEYKYIMEEISSPNFQPLTPTPKMYQKVSEQINEGKKHLETDWSNDNDDNRTSYLEKFHRSADELKPMRHAMVDYSQQWIEKLNTKQQETISSLTSSQFILLQASLSENDKDYNHHIINSMIDKDDYYDKYGDNAQEEILKEKKRLASQFRKEVLSAFDNVPRLEKPIMTYRGTSTKEINEILNLDPDTSAEEIITHINNNKNNKNTNQKSRINQIPVSTSTNPSIGKNFGEDAVIEIKRKTMTSPVNVSAWGSTEAEVLTNPQSTYTIHNAYIKKERDRTIITLQLEEQ